MVETFFADNVAVHTKLIYVDEDIGEQRIGKENEETNAIKSGIDDLIFFYVPDVIFNETDDVIAKYVTECCF